MQDAFTRFYEAPLLLDLLDLLARLGFRPWLAPFQPNGKPLHVHGFLQRFRRVAAVNAASLNALAEGGVPLVGLDRSMTLTYRAEYRAALGAAAPDVLLLQEFLARNLDRVPPRAGGSEMALLPHCTERTTALPSLGDWQAVFARFGVALRVLPLGCCGMAGTYGHEVEHRALSEGIYRQSWARHVAVHRNRLLASGYSCRCQAATIDAVRLPHPVQALLGLLKASP